VVAAQQLSGAPNNAPSANPPSSAALTGSSQTGQKGDIQANFGGLPTAKNPAGPSSATVGHTGTGEVSGKTGRGIEFNSKKASSSQVSYGADNLPNSPNTAFGGGNFANGAGGATFTGAKEQVSKMNIATDGQNQPTVNLGANNANGVATGLNGASNGKQKYGFKDSGNDNFDVNPSSADGTQGGIDSNPTSGKGAGQFKYTAAGAASKTGQSTAQLADAQPAAGRSAFNWTCTGDGTGPSICKDPKGNTVGSVKKDDQGHTLVYDAKGNVVGRSSVTKGANAKTYEVDIGETAGTAKTRGVVAPTTNANNGLYLAQVDDWSSSDCYAEQNKGAKNPYGDAIKVQQPLKFLYNQNSAGQYNYPDCF
jgi:hypothetical protein